MMRMKIAIMIVGALCLVGMSALIGEAATTFNGSTIISVDQAQRTITFKTKEGHTWTLPVADPQILKAEQMTEGKQVSIEIDLRERVTKVIQLFEEPGDDVMPSIGSQ